MPDPSPRSTSLTPGPPHLEDASEGPSRPIRVGMAVLAFMLPLLVYLRTLAREITFIDSGELTATAATLGIAHPPGYPLFSLLGRVFALLPVESTAFRVGLVSAVSAAATSLLIYLVATRVGRQLFPERNGLVQLVTALGVSLLFAFARTPWSQAVVVEVYALQGLLVAAFLTAAALAIHDRAGSARWWPLAGFATVLALTHHLTGMLLLPALVTLVIVTVAARGRSVFPAIVISVVVMLLPFFLYLYLPLRSRLSPIVSWSYPETWQTFLVHVTARQYHGALGREGIRVQELSRFMGQQLPGEATWLFVILTMVGWLVLWHRAWRFALTGSVMVVAFLLYNAAYPIPDIHLYYVPTLVVLGVWAAIGAVALATVTARMSRGAGVVVALLFCLGGALPLRAHWQANDQRQFNLVAHYVRDSLRYLEDDAVVFSGRWDSFSSPSLYYQFVEGVRPDVVVIDVGQLSNPSFERRYGDRAGDVVAACRGPMEAVADIARRAERGDPYDVSAARQTFRGFRRQLVEESMARRPTYLTGDLYGTDMFGDILVIPEGLVGHATGDSAYRPFPVPRFDGPDLPRASIRTSQEQEILFEYSRMLSQRARYLAFHGHEQEGMILARRAAALLQP